MSEDAQGGPGAEDPRLQTVADLFRGRYAVERRLPWNGLALVFRAVEPGRDVAVAVLPLDVDGAPEVGAAFERHADLLEALEHPRLLPVTDSGVQHGVPYLEIDYVDGTPLRQVLGRGAVAAPLVRRIVGQLLDALEAAHATGVYHWDLTPSNVLLVEGDEGPEVRLIGLGIAPLLAEARHTDTTGPTGRGSGPSAARYLAPELLWGRPADEPSDVYSVGALLRHMVTGELPPSQRKGEADVSEGVPPALGVLLERAMAFDPEDRFADVATLREAFDNLPDEALRAAGAEPERVASAGSTRPAAEAEDSGNDGRQAAPGSNESRGTSQPPDTPHEPVVPQPSGAERASGPRDGPAPAPGAFLREPDTRDLAQLRAARGFSKPLLLLLAATLLGGGGFAAWQLFGEGSGDASAGADAPIPQWHPPPARDAGRNEAPPAEPLAGELPPLLAGVHERTQRGEKLDREQLKPLYEYAQTHGDRDARVHLVLAHAFMLREWYSDAIDRYRKAYETDPDTRHDDEMLPDLLHIVRSTKTLGDEAAQTIVAIYGADALAEVDQALSRENRPRPRRELEKLRARLDRQR